MEYLVNGKTYKTLEEAKKAEDAFNEAEQKKLQLIATKKEKAAAIEEAFKEFTATERKASDEFAKKVSDARKVFEEAREDARNEYLEKIKNSEEKYNELKNQFIKDYGSYHLSYYSDGGREYASVFDMMNEIFNILK